MQEGWPVFYETTTSIDFSKITTSQELAEALNKAAGSDDYIATTIPGTNYPAACSSYSFYQSYVLGNDYPQNGFCIKDSKFCSFNCDYTMTYDDSKTTWTRSSGTSYNSSNIQAIRYTDIDAGNFKGNSFCATKTLFNGDDSWEWIEYAYSEPTKHYEYFNIDQQVSGKSFTATRGVSEYADVAGVKIMSENGTILTITAPKASLRDIYKMSGKVYFEINSSDTSGSSTSLYEYTPGTTNAKKVISNISTENQTSAKYVMNNGKIAIRAIDGKIYTTDGAEIK